MIDRTTALFFVGIFVIVPLVAVTPLWIINSYPSQEAIVTGKVEKDGYTECIVSVNNATMTTNEMPCLHKPGDIVTVRVDATSAEILREAHGKECEPAWYTTFC